MAVEYSKEKLKEALAVIKWGHYYRQQHAVLYKKNGQKLKRPKVVYDERPPYPKGSSMSVDVAHFILVRYLEDILNENE